MQSFRRQMKRGNLIPVWNSTLKKYDFFRKLKNTGRFVLTNTPFSNSQNGQAPGPGNHWRTILKFQKQAS